MTAPLLDSVIRPLWAAWAAAHKARDLRQPLNLDLPERRIVLSDEGKVLSVAFRERLDAHRLIEDFMILANVAAAETLEAKRIRLLYRVHEEPSPEKLEALREIVEIGRPDAGQGPGAEDRAPQPPARRRRRHRARRDGQHERARAR